MAENVQQAPSSSVGNSQGYNIPISAAISHDFSSKLELSQSFDSDNRVYANSGAAINWTVIAVVAVFGLFIFWRMRRG